MGHKLQDKGGIPAAAIIANNVLHTIGRPIAVGLATGFARLSAVGIGPYFEVCGQSAVGMRLVVG